MIKDIEFSEIEAPAPQIEDVAREYGDIESALTRPQATLAAKLSAVARWDALRRRIRTWSNLVGLQFRQDTANAAYRAAKENADLLAPKLMELEVSLKRLLLADPDRKMLEAELGAHAFNLWECDVTTFEPAIADDLIAQSRLEDEYTQLIASARIEFGGQALNLSDLLKYRDDAVRGTRHDAVRAFWGFFAEHGAQLDRIYDDLVTLRDGMAHKLGFENFIGLGYKIKRRVDYDASMVARYRDQVAEHVVPVAAAIIERLGRDGGLGEVMYWDEAVLDPRGNPAPGGDTDWTLAQARAGFDALDPAIGDFFKRLCEGGLIDVEGRPGKAHGGFCTLFPVYGWPFVFANFNGTHGDVRVLVHETGHAFQNFSSRHLQLLDYLNATSESAEVHSMSLEYLSFPQMNRFFGEDAERYRRQHLAEAMLFLPYGVAVDHFQHLVYAQPGATAADRHGMWKEVEARYLPWRRYGDVAYPAMGGFWQEKQHIFVAPFYYIDYTLALCCALQFWARAQDDHAGALAGYVRLCGRGGSAPFGELVRSAGLRSPFESGTLADVVARVRAVLRL